MGKKNVNRYELNWQAANPAPFVPNAPATGVLSGAMASTNTVYTQILDIRTYDNVGLEVTWTGTPTGTIQIMGSVSGQNFYALTFNPILAQPSGSAGGYLIDLNQFPFYFFIVQYTNASGSGSLTAWASYKDLN